jgi:hypothetical protein
MGNIITKDTDTIHWESNKNNNNNQLTTESKLLLDRLLPDRLDASSEKPQNNQNIHQTTGINQLGGGNLSDTSPFISSDMYNHLIKVNNNLQRGGGNIKNADDSSTSSTSSSEDGKKKHKKNSSKSDKTTESVDISSASGSDLSYVSSSAHTGGGSSESSRDSERDSERESDSEPESSPKLIPNDSQFTTAEDSYIPQEVTESIVVSEPASESIVDSIPEVSIEETEKPSKKSKKSKKQKEQQKSEESVSEQPRSEESISNNNSVVPPSINTDDIQMVSAS